MYLESDRLIYNKFDNSHFPDYTRLVSQEEVMKHITGKGLTVNEAQIRFQVALDADQNREDMGFLAVTEKATGAFIGLAKIVPFENGMTEIGYALLPEFWNKGYASEITKRLIVYAKELGNISELIGVVDPGNHPSIHVLTKQDFVFYREVINDKNFARMDYILKL
ncbi:GNAT family N-acetyltransferase [Dyadobacter sp. NIV53]|uniref:GNAT family N-acetyltransferase n=1 Tax=Dyadobacter sp. NIV53 TaxID=2861765 RepID=UPI001C888C65|nr:GNAT family N-acetyltransferase [Dyadobacter sp. NIV53]